jgi:EAL domain-containing protein (putative c-di-GMP-specific phosphodiesterase class I)
VRDGTLVRWAHPGGALVPPGEWLPLIERTAVISQLGDWVLATALQACAASQPGHPGVGPQLPLLEVVESAPVTALPAALATLRACTAVGADFVLEDFGTGYSSLAHLKRLPVGVVKFDRSFVASLVDSESDRRIMQGMV